MENLNVKVSDNVQELVIRQGEAEPVVELRNGEHIVGDVTTPVVYLKNPPKWFSEFKEGCSPLEFSSLIVSLDNLSLKLIVDEGRHWKSTYEGRLVLSKQFELFKINTGKSFTTFELADLFKMNRSFFESKDSAMKLVSELRNFKAKVDKQVENADDNRGNKRVLMAQAVDSNLPSSFKLNIPLFKNQPKHVIEIEVAINASDLSCSLVSPEANDIISDVAEGLINAELGKVKKLFPQLKIYNV